MTDKILFVDDDEYILEALERGLRHRFNLEIATSGEAGLEKIDSRGPFAVVVSDRQMPNMDGIQFLSTVRQRAPDTVRIMLTGNVDLEQAVLVVNEVSIFRFLIKPSSIENMEKALEDALAQHRLITAERELLDKTLDGSTKLLTDILSMVDTKSFGRAEKLRAVMAEISGKIPLAEAWEINLAAMLAPIGYVTLPPETLIKARAGTPLSKNEEQLVDSIPEIAARLLANIPRFEGVSRIVRYQHKRFDGGGYPADAMRGEDLPLGARLLKILIDMLELQGRGATPSQALDELPLRQGWYDPQLLASIRACFGIVGGKPNNVRRTISITADSLAIGMILGSDLFTKDGTLVLSAGHHINEMFLERIQNFNLLYGIQEPIFVRVL
jgi:response regulator RpfG family c-di-GMP phosphodiesterase